MAHIDAGLSVVPARDRAERVSPIGKDCRRGVVLAIGSAVLAGVLVSVTMPRGPTTQAQALLVLVGGLLVGVLAGVAMVSR